MFLKHIFWWFKQALPSRLCDHIVKFGLQQKNEMALTGNIIRKFSIEGRNLKKNPLTALEKAEQKQTRDSRVSFISAPWLYREINPYINLADKNAEWNFQWDFTESFQFTQYESGQYYGWHCDSYPEPYDQKKNLNYHGKIRKLSVVINLSHGKDYKGGDLELLRHDAKNKKMVCEQMRNRGSLIVFPSFIYHRVTPVRKGTRLSLVGWSLGLPFK